MTNEDLDAIEKLLAAATPGPWRRDTKPGTHLVYTPGLPGFSASCHEPEDAAIIVAAVNAAPVLIAEVRRLRALPAIATCDACGWSRTLLGGRDCTHGAAAMVIGSASHDPPPPSWCPLRRSP